MCGQKGRTKIFVHDLCMWEELPQEKEGLEKEGKR
jgi:hypothetical protein